MKKFAPGVAPVRGVVLLSPGQFIVTAGKIVIDYNLCDVCGICVKECPVKALYFEVFQLNNLMQL
ncbi:MAG TPA: 4Fe-4S binding protein [Candidatus Nanoarchaeia archaeon]|nr:4Fe-4S binding protein [Candidatus Nanoarchaeia archaeon]